MAENGEAVKTEIDTNQKEILQAKKEVDDVLRQIKNDEEKRQLEEKIKTQLHEKEDKALELNQYKKNIPQEEIKEAKSVKTALVATLRAVEKDVIKPPGNSSRFFKNLTSQRISDKLTDNSAPSIYALVNNFLDRDIRLSDIKQGFSGLKDSGLEDTNPSLFYSLMNALRATAEEMGMSEEDAIRFFNLKKNQETDSLAKENKKLEKRQKFERAWEYYGMDSFFSSSQKEIVLAIDSPQDFAEYIARRTYQYRQDNGLGAGNLKEEDYQVICEKIREEVVIVFGNIYRSVNESKAKEFFEKIVSAGYMNSPQTVQATLSRKLETLIAGFENKLEDFSEDEKSFLTGFNFYKEKFVNKDIDRLKKVDEDRTKVMTVNEPLPLTESKKCSINDFIRSISVEVEHEIEWTEYLHNIGALMTRSVDRDGFWPKIAGYADGMSATDIDGIMSLPDADVINAAYRLYTKYLQGEFAKYNWVHQPTMFSSDAQSNKSPLQLKIINDLKMMFPQFKEEPQRIARAMSMGLGLSRGVFITEQELAAWADPSVKLEDGSPTYRSYYTNDNAALNALNSAHTFFRWQSESSMRGPLLMALVSGIEPSFLNFYDHKQLFANATKRQEAWDKGELAYDRKNPSMRTMAELLLNLPRVGSFVSRGGWTLMPEIEGLIVWNKTEIDGIAQRSEKDIDKFKSFKSIEYVGFDALFAFVNDQIATNDYLVPEDTVLLLNKAEGKRTTLRIEDVFRKSKEIAVEAERADKLSNRDKLLKHIFNKYFPGEKNRSIGEVYDKLNEYIAGARDEIDVLIKQGKLVNADVKTKIGEKDYYINSREKAIVAEVYKRFIYRGMAGVIQDRLPSKFVTLERSRTSKDGERLWEKIAIELQKENKEEITSEIMDSRLQDLMMVETELRQETSKQMKKYQKEIYKHNKRIDFSDFEEEVHPSFKITEESIREKLTKILKNSREFEKNDILTDKDIKARVEKAVSLFKLINKHCYNEEYLSDFREKIRPTDALGKIKNKYFPFSIAPEELENSLLSWRASGEKALKRRLGDVAGAETEVFAGLDTFLKSLNTVATGEKHDVKPLVESIAKISGFLGSIISKDYGQKVAHDLAMMTINYFRKDSIADNWITGIFRLGAKNSLAAEFAGPGIPVWEWGRKDIDAWINTLATAGILPLEPYDLSKPPTYEKRAFKLFGKKIFEYQARKPDVEYCGLKLRASIGAQLKQMAVLEFGGTAIPLALLLFLLLALKKGFGEMSNSNK